MSKITLSDFIDLIDVNRESEEYVDILDHNGNVDIHATVCSGIWDLMGDRTVNSIQADDGVIQIWLDDESEVRNEQK